MIVLEVGIFAGSPSVHARARHCLAAGLERLRAIWPHLAVRTRLFAAPDDLAGFVVVAGETHPVAGFSMIAAGAAAPDPERATAIFCAEVAERAACAWYGTNATPRRCSAADLAAAGESTFDCGGYLGTSLAPRRTGFASFDPGSVYDWVAGECVSSGAQTWIPLPLVSPLVPSAQRFCEQTTIGCAAGADIGSATTRALEELVERHTLRVAWFLDRPFDEVRNPSSAGAGKATSWTTRFYRAGAGSGRVLAVLYGRHRSLPLYTIGSGCGATWAEASEHALRETIQSRLVAWLYRHRHPAVAAVRSYPDHHFWYSRPNRIGCVDRFFDRPMKRNDPAAGCSDDTDLTANAVRLTLLDEPDLKVVRVLSPSLQPLEARHDAIRLVGPWHRSHPSQTLQTAPHPFA